MGTNHALGGATAVAIAALATWRIVDLDAESQKILAATLAAIAATLIGFVVAAASIMWTAGKTQLVQMMRKTGHYDSLLADFRRVTLAYTVVCVVGLAAIMLHERQLMYVTATCEILFVLGSWLFIRAALRFFVFLRFANPAG